MQKRLGGIKVKKLIEARHPFSHIVSLKPDMKLTKPRRVADATITRISDAAHGGNKVIYRQTYGVVGLRIRHDGSTEELLHIVNWTSHKQKRVS